MISLFFPCLPGSPVATKILAANRINFKIAEKTKNYFRMQTWIKTYIYLCTMLQLISAISNKSMNNFQYLSNSIPWKSVPRLLEESFQLWQQPYRRLRKKDYFVIQDRATRTWRGLCRVVDKFLAFFVKRRPFYVSLSLHILATAFLFHRLFFIKIAINTGVSLKFAQVQPWT